MLRQSYRYASGSAVRRTLWALKDVFTHQDSQSTLRTLVSIKAECRISVPISAPPGWRMVFATFPSIFGDNTPCSGPNSPWGKLICCEEPLEVMGYLQYWSCRQQSDEDSSDEDDSDDEQCDDSYLYMDDLRPPSKSKRVVLMGRYESIWLLDRDEDVLYYLASSLDDFARHGLMHCESIYTGKFRMPILTTQPDDMVSMLRMNDHSVSHLKCVMARYRWQCLPLRTPGEMTRPLMICGEPNDLKSCWPFLCMDDQMFAKLMQFFKDRLCCDVLIFGVVGEVLPSGSYHAEWVVIMDMFGEFFYFDVYRREVCRLANDLDSLLTIGLLKIYQAGRRFSCALSDAERLEVPTHCPHRTYQFWDRYLYIDRGAAHRSYDTRFRWLTRRDRFRPLHPGSCYGRNSYHEVAGAADASWEPHLRCDFPQATEVEAAHSFWRRLSDHVHSKEVRQGTRCYSIWTQMNPQLEREIARLRSMLSDESGGAAAAAAKDSDSVPVVYVGQTKPQKPQKPQKPPRQLCDDDMLETDGGAAALSKKTENAPEETDSNSEEEEDAKEVTCDYYSQVLVQRAAKAALLEGRPFPRPDVPRPGLYLPPWL
ncbi:protein US26 [Cercopithecine betaherpesvirus 5]|uniref:Protein US26 n=1 Tax=Simian cytomegalovirus (strain Colburn) TaxID=50292 RepID=G8XTN1_SCMVC|nr:protein US26 [Cercopithecine betaherpesvirus 5]AEV80523.1 protein US26 [Cercopithecine betaherpesvirus 5]